MDSIQFGNVLAYKGFDKSASKQLVTPFNRVVHDPWDNIAYVITGTEDIQTVDDAFTHIKAFSGEQQKSLCNQIRSGIWRFLYNKASKPYGDSVSQVVREIKLLNYGPHQNE